MDSLQLLQVLRENDLNDIKQLNSFVCEQLNFKSTVDYCYFNEVGLQNSPDDFHFTTSKETFQGKTIFDKIDPMKKNNYFHIMINNKPKYLHKQTVARLLSTSKNNLSSDRLFRVQQTNKQK